MKIIAVLLLTLSLSAFAQEANLSKSDKDIVLRAANFIENARSITILYEQRTRAKELAVVTFSDKVWQQRFAESLRRSEGVRNPLHVLSVCLPLVAADMENEKAKVTIDFPKSGSISIELEGARLDYILHGDTYASLLSMAEQKKANQAPEPTS